MGFITGFVVCCKSKAIDDTGLEFYFCMNNNPSDSIAFLCIKLVETLFLVWVVKLIFCEIYVTTRFQVVNMCLELVKIRPWYCTKSNKLVSLLLVCNSIDLGYVLFLYQLLYTESEVINMTNMSIILIFCKCDELWQIYDYVKWRHLTFLLCFLCQHFLFIISLLSSFVQE